MSDTRPKFRSWVEDYRPPVEEQPIDREAFRARAVQRAAMRRYLEGAYQPFKGALTSGARSKLGYERAISANAIAEHNGRAARRTCPVEKAKLHLQRRRVIVFRSSVTGGRRDLWTVPGRGELSDEQLLELAERKGWRGSDA
jgi:hypothetical protein